MRRFINSALVLCTALFTLASCQREEINTNDQPAIETHTVVFTAQQVATKTESEIDGETVKYSWKDSDQEGDKFAVFENGNPATLVVPSLDNTTGRMTISATFGGSLPSNPKYIAHFNTGINASQYGDETDYAQDSDVMYSAEAEGDINQGLMFCFTRVSALGQVTLKGLSEGDYVSSVIIESTDGKILAAKYDFENGQFSSSGSSAIAIESSSIIDNGQAVVRFVTAPVTDAMLKVTVITNDEDDYSQVAAYEKTFTKPISFSAGNLTMFNVALGAGYNDPHANDNGWFLVKDVRALNVGDEIRIGCAEKGTVASAFGDKTFFNKVDGTFENETVNAPDAITITLGKDGANWTMTTSEGVVGTSAAKTMTLDNEAATNTWAIEISADGIATIASTNEDYGKILYNHGSPRFLNYTSNVTTSMLLPQIYKKYGTPEEQHVKQTPTISFSPKSVEYTLGDEEFEAPELTSDSDGAITWESSNEDVASVDTEGNVTITATEAGSAIITVHFAESDNYNAGDASYTITVKEAPIVSGDKYILVTSEAELTVGDQVIIAAKDANVAISTTQNSSNRGQAAITKNTSNNTAIITDDVQVFVVEAGTKENTFSFNTGSGYIYAASSSANNLKTEANKSDNSSWSISISTDGADITAQGKNTRNLLRHNNSSSLFSCYESGQNAVVIYKLDDGKQNQALSFGSATEFKTYTDVSFVAPTLTGAQTTVTYSSSNESVATVNASTGEVEIVGAGTTTITADAEASGNYRAASASYTINVIAAYESLAALVAAGTPTANGETVKVTITEAAISRFYKSGSYTNGIFTDVVTSAGTQEIEIYCKDVPAEWGIGGKISAIVECPWKLYTSGDNSTWELCPTSWEGFAYTSAPKTLTGLSWTGYTASYTAGSSFSFDGTIKAEYSDGSSKTLQYSEVVLTSEPDLSVAGSTTATISYTEGGITKTATASITVTAQGGTGNYKKITSAPSDWSGTYIIAYVNGASAYVYNGTDSSANNGVSATINNNEIEPSNFTEIEIAKMTGGYSLKIVGGTNNGKYLSGGTSNGTTFNTNAVANSISLNSDGTVKINNNTTTSFQFNSASDQQRFRYFKSAQKGVTLFKK